MFRHLQVAPSKGQTVVGATIGFLKAARFSEPAFTGYEQQLKREGLVNAADDVFFAMHHKRRAVQASITYPGTWLTTFLDMLQEFAFGYGRSVLAPAIWSLVFVGVGVFVFGCGYERNRMETTGASEHKAPPFSAIWYSLELFLPVVDLGMAKAWRPVGGKLATYARLHQLAGWVLIPIGIAALTGIGK